MRFLRNWKNMMKVHLILISLCHASRFSCSQFHSLNCLIRWKVLNSPAATNLSHLHSLSFLAICFWSEEGNVPEKVFEINRAKNCSTKQSFRCCWAQTLVQVFSILFHCVSFKLHALLFNWIYLSPHTYFHLGALLKKLVRKNIDGVSVLRAKF